MHRVRSLALLSMVAMGLALGLALPEAANAAPPTGIGGAPTSCSDYAGLTNRVVMCIRDTLDGVTSVYFAEFYPKVKQIIGGFLTLVIIVYGILAAFGMLEKPSRDVMVLLVKLSFVTFFVANVDEMYFRATDMMDAAGAAVVEYTPSTGQATDLVSVNDVTCIQNMKDASAKAGEPYVASWLAMDCMLDSVIGIHIPTSVSGKTFSKGLEDLAKNAKLEETPGMSRGLISFFFSSMQSSVLGILMAIVGFIFIYTIVWLIAKAMFVYIAGYLGIAFMMIFAPLFIPLVLFRVTKEYFSKWVKLVISFILQPVIILVFISFSITAVDLAMFSGDYSIMYRIAGDASRGSTFNINKYLETNDVVIKKPTVVAGVKTGTKSTGLEKAGISGAIKGLTDAKCTQAIMKADPKAKAECENFYPIQWWRNSIDWNKMALARTPAVTDPGAEPGDAPSMTADDRKGRAISREVAAAVLFAAVVVFIMNGLLAVVPMIANDLVGESFQSPNLFGSVARAGVPGGGGLSSAMSGRISGLMSGSRR